MSRSSLQSAVGAAVAADRQAVPGLGSVALLGALAALALAVAALSTHHGDTLAAIAPWLLACGVVAAGLGVCAALLRQQAMQARMHAQLLEARSEAAALSGLIVDAWLWRSDAAHLVTLLRPPARADAASLHSALGRPLWEAFGAEPDAAALLHATVRSGCRFEELYASHARADGAVLAFALSGAPRADGQGRPEGYVGIARACGDDGAASAAESAAAGVAIAAPASAPVASPVASVAGAAGHAPASASAAPGDHGRDLFAASVAHDLGTPLRAVEGFARILKEDHATQLDRLGNVHLDRVIAAASRMKAMLEALLALARLSAQPVVRSPADLSGMAGAVIEELRLHSPGREVAVHIEPDLYAEGDPVLLRVLLDNLLGNAWKYTGKKAGGAAIRFERTEHAGRRAFTVSDNGAGFDMGFAGQLFEPFGRLHPASEFEGTGMGLASVHRIVTCHGGDIWVDAGVGRGCSFHFTLAPPSSTSAP